MPKKKKPGALCTDCGHYNNDINICNQTMEGASTRSYERISNYLKAFAWWQDNSEVSSKDLEVVLPFNLGHRLTPTRQAVEKNVIYSNDPIAFVSDLVEKANRSYDMVASKTPVLKDVTSVIARIYSGNTSGIKRSDIETLLKNDVQKIDSPSKFGLATALFDCYTRLK